MATVKDFMMGNVEKHRRYGKEFLATFDRPLSQFWHNIFGFDIIAFDKWLGTPDGVSTHDYLVERYDNVACELIKSLL